MQIVKWTWLDMALLVADDNNTRVLFEKVLSSMPKDKARLVIDLTSKHASLNNFETSLQMNIQKII